MSEPRLRSSARSSIAVSVDSVVGAGEKGRGGSSVPTRSSRAHLPPSAAPVIPDALAASTTSRRSIRSSTRRRRLARIETVEVRRAVLATASPSRQRSLGAVLRLRVARREIARATHRRAAEALSVDQQALAYPRARERAASHRSTARRSHRDVRPRNLWPRERGRPHAHEVDAVVLASARRLVGRRVRARVRRA